MLTYLRKNIFHKYSWKVCAESVIIIQAVKDRCRATGSVITKLLELPLPIELTWVNERTIIRCSKCISKHAKRVKETSTKAKDR